MNTIRKTTIVQDKNKTVESDYLSVGDIASLSICDRKYFYSIRYKDTRKHRKNHNKRNNNKNSRTTSHRSLSDLHLKQSLLSSANLLVRGMCKTIKDTHPPVPVVVRNRLDEKPWEIVQAEMQLYIYALLYREQGLKIRSGMIIDPEKSNKSKEKGK